jgi:hypothetical protein
MPAMDARLLALALGAALAACAPDLSPAGGSRSAGVSIDRIARGETDPQIGLGAPFPAWAPLPQRGQVTGAEVLPPQPPWGASAVIMMRIDETYDAFTVGYRRRLAERGFELKPIPIQPNLVIDAPLAQFQADETAGGHVVYVTYRGGARARYVQLTYLSPPSPLLEIR